MIQSDVSVDWQLSPRIITVGDSLAAITIQDLIDTCRSLEHALPEGMDFPHLIDAAGKDSLGGGVYVGVTVTLQNAKLAFEARGGPSFVQCNASGGNLVAVDENGNNIDPIQTTAYTQVVRTSSSSATLQELEAIEHSSFDEAVNIDENNVTGRAIAGTAYPAGTRNHPSDNLTDVTAIQAERGFGKIRVYGDLNIDSQVVWDVQGLMFIGDHAKMSSVDINDQSLTQNCVFKNLTVTGTLDGNNVLEDCIIPELIHIEGECYKCEIEGKLTLAGTSGVHLRDCYAGTLTSGYAEVDMGGSGRNLSVHRWSGHLKISNLTGPSIAIVSANAGALLIVANTCTAGQIIVCGVGVKIVDQRPGGSTCEILENYNVTPANVWNLALEGTLTAIELMRLMSAALAGKLSGAPGSTITIRDAADQKDRIVATVDSDGNRTAITLDVTE